MVDHLHVHVHLAAALEIVDLAQLDVNKNKISIPV